MESQVLPFSRTPTALVNRRRPNPYYPRRNHQIPFPPSSLSSPLIRIKTPITSLPLYPRLPLPPRASSCSHGDSHHHHHGHGHSHGHSGELNGAQKAVLGFAKAVGWAELADLLREHLQLCCCSMALLLMAAMSPYLVPARSVKTLQGTLIAIAFPLVGVFLFAFLLLIALNFGRIGIIKIRYLCLKSVIVATSCGRRVRERKQWNNFL